MMRHVPAEFTTTEKDAPDDFGDSGCLIRELRSCPIALRHEYIDDFQEEIVYLFAREPELGAQVFIHQFPMPGGIAEFEERSAVFIEQQKDFKLPKGQTFGPDFLAPAVCDGFAGHAAFRTRDGRYRRRIVHIFTGNHRSVVLVYSRDDIEFKDSEFCQFVSDHLTLQDVEFDSPFDRR